MTQKLNKYLVIISETMQGGGTRKKKKDFPIAGPHPAHSFHPVGLCAELI